MTSENCLIERVAIVLVEPAEGGNVGSCCRALVNCGFSGFSMVRPRVADWAEARKMAVHAASMLDAARTYDSLRAAVADAHWVVGVSGRPRSHPQGKQPIGLGDLTDRLRRLPAGGKAALVFGPERAGLTNAQLGLCQDILRLPTAEAYTSMNLAHAVLVVAWTIRMAGAASAVEEAPDRETVGAAELDGLMEQAERTLKIIGYLDPQNPRLTLDELRWVFSRAGLGERELRMLRGVFHRMDVWISNHGGPPTPNQLRRLDDS